MPIKLLALTRAALILLLTVIVFYACSKGSSSAPTPTPDPCAGVTVSVSATVTDADAGSSNGSIAASATGGTGAMTYSINGGAFQASGTFNNLAKGSYSITAKDTKGCTGSKSYTVNEKNACAGVTITISNTISNSDPCSATGSIVAAASGSTGFTYSIDNGAFQASGTFNNVSVGNHTITAKDGAGCSQAVTASVGTVAIGALYTAAKAVIQNNCAISGCHTGGSPTGGISFSSDCNIINNKDRIKARAIDGNPSIMPPTGALPQADKDKLMAWINAGGRFTD